MRVSHVGFHKDIFKPSLSKSTAQTVLNLNNQLSTIQSKLQAQDFTGMTKDDILGSLLYATAISYYAEYDVMDQMQAKGIGVRIARVPSEVVFSVTMNVSYMFGVATSISPAGLKMDVQRNLELTQATNGDNNKVIQYMSASGMNSSALENGVPEQLFSTSTNPVQGVSAIKAIEIANNEGIPIYIINQSNISTVLPQLQLSPDVISDIQDAVNAGKAVTVSQTDITYNGWTGVMIASPVVGAILTIALGAINLYTDICKITGKNLTSDQTKMLLTIAIGIFVFGGIVTIASIANIPILIAVSVMWILFSTVLEWFIDWYGNIASHPNTGFIIIKREICEM